VIGPAYGARLEIPGFSLDSGALLQPGPDASILYAEPRLRTGSGMVSIRAGALRVQGDAVARAEIRDSYYQIERGAVRGRLGFQSLSWGETFGFFIADLPNPRDWRDPLLLDVGFVKKPVFMGQLQWFGDSGSVQAFVTPITRHQDFLPGLETDIPGRRSLREFGRDSEAGIRASRLWDSGLDSSLFVVSHLDRTLVLNPGRVLSAGLTGSQAFTDQWVLRTDQVWREGSDGLHWQGVAGLDWSPSGTFTVGTQLQHEPGLWGASLRVARRGWAERWDLEAFCFAGLGGSSAGSSAGEFWLQPKISYQTSDGISLSLRYDWIARPESAGGNGFFPAVSDSDRALLWVSFRY
jgi:hypothetical protein